jgi:hypothetical protein
MTGCHVITGKPISVAVFLPNFAVEWLAFLHRIQVVHSSNLDLQTVCRS